MTNRWYESDEMAEVWADRCDYLESLSALNRERFAALHAEDDALVVIDEQAGDDWIASARADYDVEQGA